MVITDVYAIRRRASSVSYTSRTVTSPFCQTTFMISSSWGVSVVDRGLILIN